MRGPRSAWRSFRSAWRSRSMRSSRWMPEASTPEVTARIVKRAADIAASEWNACAGPGNPFLQHAFFVALEESGSASIRTGWQPVHLVVDADDGAPGAIMPAYLKSHSQGEYLFDHGWADAWTRAGGDYYPKLQSCVPFTPATGPRLLLRLP